MCSSRLHRRGLRSTRDPDVASGMARFVHEPGMTPVDHCDRNQEQGVCCGCAGGRKPDRAEIEVLSGCDLYELHEAVKAVGVDLLMVNLQRKYIADGEGLAFARVGFPVQDLGWLPAKSDHRVWRRDRSCRSDHERDSVSCGRVTWHVCERVFFMACAKVECRRLCFAALLFFW